MPKYSEKELDSAIKTCIEFLWNKNNRTESNNGKRNIIDIMKHLQNKDGNEYSHRYPYSLLFKITSGCNLRCKHCFYSDKPNLYYTQRDLDEDTLFNYLKFFVEEINIISCSLTGGEIFTVPYFIRFLKYLKSKNIIVELLTNGTLINNDDAIILSNLLNRQTDSIQISLEGPEKINDFIRGDGVFKKVKNSIKLLTDKNIRICISMTVNALNACSIEEMYDICREMKVSQLNIGKMIICNEAQNKFSSNIDDIVISIANTIKKAEKFKDLPIKIRALKAFDFLGYENGRKYIDKILEQGQPELTENLHCRARGEQLVLFPTGDISLCYNCECEDLYIGNLQEKSFDEIWDNRHNKAIFQYRGLDSTCKKCKYVTLCKGGCPINSYNKYKTINAPDSNCFYAEEKIKSNEWVLEDIH